MGSRKDYTEYSKFAQILEQNVEKYGKEILILKDIESAMRTECSDENWNEVDLNYVDDNYYTPLTIAMVTMRDDPIKIEKMRLIENSDVKYAFHQATIESSNSYAKLLLDLYGEECFENVYAYNKVLSLLTKNNNVKIMELVCEIVCRNELKHVINFEYLKLNDKNGVLYPHTILLEGIENCSLDCIRVLLKYGAVLYTDYKYKPIASTVELWKKIFCTNYPRSKLKLAIISIITVMKNCYLLPDKETLNQLFNQFIDHYKLVDDNCRNHQLIKAKEYLKYLIDKDKFHSLEHYSRNVLRQQRIEDNSNCPVINPDEQQFFF